MKKEPQVAASAVEEVIKCKYAGDPNDTLCCKCDGLLVITEEGDEYKCTDCGGYEPEEIEAAPEEKPVSAVAEAAKKIIDKSQAADPVKIDAETTEESEGYQFTSKAITTEIQAESGVSVEIKDKSGKAVWYKFSYTEKRTIPEDANLEEEKALLWADVNRTVDSQVDQITS